MKHDTHTADEVGKSKQAAAKNNEKEEADPFGLDALIPGSSKKVEKAKMKKEVEKIRKEEEDEMKRFLKSQREALIICLEIASRRYKTAW